MTKRNGIYALTAALAVMLLSISLFAAPSGAVGSNTPTVTISGSPNPGSTTGSVTYTVSVTGSAGAATGSVDVSDGATGTCSIPDITMSTSCAFTEPTPGSYTVTATYSGDSNYTTGTATTPETIVGPSSTAVSNNSTSIATGGALVFTAKVSSTAGGTPAGTVAWGGTSVCTTSTTTVDTSEQATCTISDAKANTSYSVTAAFSDTDGFYDNSNGSDGPVSPATAPSDTLVTDNSSPATVTGGTFTYTATVSGAGGIPAGAIAWTGVTCSSTTPLAGGTATCKIANAQASTSYAATASFTDSDSNYADSSSSDSTAVVSKAAATVPIITDLPTSGTFGSGFTATFNNNVSNGMPSVTSSTPAVCSSSGLAVSYVGVGTCSLNAQVAAGPNYLASSGAAQTITIGRAVATTPTITDIPSPANEFFGFTAIVGTTGDGTTTVTSSTPKVCSVGSNALTVTFVGFGTCTLTPSVAQGPNHFGATGSPQSFPVQEASHGYWLVGSDGGIFSFGTAAFHGSMGSTPLQRPVVAITPTLTGNGYWLVASDGGIFSFGDSTYYGSLPALGFHPSGSGVPQSLNAPIVGMVPSFTGHGYFMVASDGGVFAFGDAKFAGSCPGIGGCAGTAVAVMPDHSGNGYWLVTTTGDVYAFGDAAYYGAPTPSSVPVVDAVATRDGNGYWLLFANGVVDNFGDATNFGAPTGYVNGFNPATTIFPTADDQGYWVASARGDVFSYGDSPFLGSEAEAGLNGEIIGAFGF